MFRFAFLNMAFNLLAYLGNVYNANFSFFFILIGQFFTFKWQFIDNHLLFISFGGRSVVVGGG